MLPCARKYGIKVVVDLHVTPGGRTEDREMAMFREKEYADAFVETWRRIATRLKGNADAIYGLDIVQEVSAKINALRIPRGTSVRAALVYDGDLSPSVEACGFFDAIVPASRLLGLD